MTMPRYSIVIRAEYNERDNNDAHYTAQEAEEAIRAALPQGSYIKVYDVADVPGPKREGE